MDFSALDIILPVLGLLVILVLFSGIKTVPQGYEYTVERFGRYTKTLTPGLNLILPFIDRIGAKMNMMEQVLDVPTQEVITKDNAIVSVDGVAFYQVLNAPQAAYQVSGLQNAILNLTMTNIRTVMGSMDLDELLSNRDVINERLLRVVDEAAHPWGIKVTRVEIKDINPPANLVDSMARQMMAERNKRAQILEAEGLKQAQVLEAEGRREAAFRDAEARERAAEAEARATQVVSDAIAKGDLQALNYFIAQKYTEALARIGTGPANKVVLMPLEASSLIGSLGGIGAIAKEVFGDADAALARQPRSARQRPAGPAQAAAAPPSSPMPWGQPGSRPDRAPDGAAG
jgi:regulator of protease activity HflC (stomatin/prohibitin superfamily)